MSDVKVWYVNALKRDVSPVRILSVEKKYCQLHLRISSKSAHFPHFPASTHRFPPGQSQQPTPLHSFTAPILPWQFVPYLQPVGLLTPESDHVPPQRRALGGSISLRAKARVLPVAHPTRPAPVTILPSSPTTHPLDHSAPGTEASTLFLEHHRHRVFALIVPSTWNIPDAHRAPSVSPSGFTQMSLPP